MLSKEKGVFTVTGVRSALLLFTVFFVCVLALQSFEYFPFLYVELSNLLNPLLPRSLARAGVYFIVYFLCVGSLFLVCLLRSKFVFSVFLVLIFAVYVFDVVLQLIGNPVGINKSEYELFKDAIGMAGNAVVYSDTAIKSIMICVILPLIMAIVRRAIRVRFSNVLVAFSFVFVAICVSFTSTKVFSISPVQFPAPIKFASLISLDMRSSFVRDNTHRVLSDDVLPTNNKTKNLVWVIDESINATFMQINGFYQDTTPKLLEMQSESYMYNFGVANGVGTHSALSNLVLRTGLQPKNSREFRPLAYTMPSIFQYAQRAGYLTVLMDLQMSDGAYQNWLRKDDFTAIDRYISASRDIQKHERDIFGLDELVKLLNENDRVFVKMVKFGAHWPYQQAYPEEGEIYTPALRFSAGSLSEENRDALINTYQNAVRYSVDDFLAELVGRVNLNKTDIIYTSDHGQDLRKHVLRSHGGESTEVAKVPLIFFGEGSRAKYARGVPGVRSSFQIFATSLKLLGYDTETYESYGPTLHAPATSEQFSAFSNGEGKLLTLPVN